MKFTPGPVQYSSFLLPWHLLPSAPLTVLAPHPCSAGHRSMAPGDSEVTGIEPGALLHGRIRGWFPLGQGRKDGGISSSCPMAADTSCWPGRKDGSGHGPRGLRLPLSLPRAPGRSLERVFPRCSRRKGMRRGEGAAGRGCARRGGAVPGPAP